MTDLLRISERDTCLFRLTLIVKANALRYTLFSILLIFSFVFNQPPTNICKKHSGKVGFPCKTLA